jgi:hypothetical protein
MWILIATALATSTAAASPEPVPRPKVTVDAQALATVLWAFEADRQQLLYLQLLHDAAAYDYVDPEDDPVGILLRDSTQ